MLSKNHPQLIVAITSLKKYCAHSPPITIESPSTTTLEKSLVESFVLSDIEMVDQHKVDFVADEELEMLEIIS